jgi:hypothetical protein
VLANHGSYFETRKVVKESVKNQLQNKFETRQEEAAEAEAGKEDLEMLRLAGTSGKPTLNSIVNRTPWKKGVMKHVYTGEEGDALRQSYASGVFALNGRSLTHFPKVMANTLTLQMGTLVSLRLSRNQLTVMPNSLPKYLRSLTELDLRHNHIEVLPATIELLTNLTDLKLDFNHISELPDTLTGLVSMTTLRLTENWLYKLPANFGLIPSLTTLELSNNRLDTLPGSFPKLGQLTSLNLNQCNFTSMAIMKSPELIVIPSEEERAAWEPFEDPVTKGITWFNSVTGATSNSKPLWASITDGPEGELWQTLIEIAESGITPKKRRVLREKLVGRQLE